MDSFLFVNYLEHQATHNGHLKELMAQTRRLLMHIEEQRSAEKAHIQETISISMDIYELEGFIKQLQQHYQQQSNTDEIVTTIYKHCIEFCIQVHNIDWNAQLNCKLELFHMNCQNEVSELNEEHEMELRRKKDLEQRPIVQMVRAVQTRVIDMQQTLDNAKQLAAADRIKYLNHLRELRDERNAIIVRLVDGSKQIALVEEKLQALINSYNNRVKELVAQNQALMSKLEQHNARLPDSTTDDAAVEPRSNIPNGTTTTITKLETFPLDMGKVSKATIVCEERKTPLNFLEAFKEWETKRQLKCKQTMAESIDEEKTVTNIPKVVGESNSLDTNQHTTAFTNHQTSQPQLTTANRTPTTTTTNCDHAQRSQPQPRSILRRSYVTDDEDSENMCGVPLKKRVHFAEPTEVDDYSADFDPQMAVELLNTEMGNGDAVVSHERQENSSNSTFMMEDTGTNSHSTPFNGDETETIEIFSTAEMEKKEKEKEQRIEASPASIAPKQKFPKPAFLTANKLLKRARRLSASQPKPPLTPSPLKQQASKVRKQEANAANNQKRSKIEIQECRIVKPAGSKLPTKLPIELSPQTLLPSTTTTNGKISAINATKTTAATTTTTNGNGNINGNANDSKLFKKPPKPLQSSAKHTKLNKVNDCERFFHDFLNQQQQQQKSDSQGHSSDADSTADANGTKSNKLPKADENCKPSKRKKPELDFDTFLRGTLMCSNGSDSSDAVAATPTEKTPMMTNTGDDDGDMLHFDMKFDERGASGFFGESVDDFFAEQKDDDEKEGAEANEAEEDGDFLSFDFDDDNDAKGRSKRKGKNDDFL